MRKIHIFFLIVLLFVLNNCSKVPVYPNVPEIEFVSVFENPVKDSLTINFKFKDGDGDLGLDDEDISSPFQKFDYVKDNSGNYVQLGSSPSLPPYSCKNYDTLQVDADPMIDTVQIVQNIYHFNYIVEVWVKQGSSFVMLDLSDVCPDFNGRFPVLQTKGDKGPIDGNLAYRIPSFYSGVNYILDKSFISSNKVKLKVYIFDRARHKSNVIETPEITVN